jgi:CHAT domain-containing protein/tetratricopeptide (TPR) repeat protein
MARSAAFATAIGWLGHIHRAQGRHAEAEPLYRRGLAIREKRLRPDHPDVGMSLNNLAELYRAQGRYAEAEQLYRRSLAIHEEALGPDHPDVGTSLNNLAGLYRAQGRYAEAEPLHRRDLAIIEKALGPDHPDVGAALNNLAALYWSQSRHAEAEPLYWRSLAIIEKALGADHPYIGAALNNLAALYQVQGRCTEAEPLYRRGLAIREKALGPDHPDVGTALNNLAALYRAQGRYAEAEPLYRRSLAIVEKALAPDHPDAGARLSNLAWLAFDERDWPQAAAYWRRSTEVIKRRAERGLASSVDGSSKGEAQRLSWQFAGLIKMTHRLATEGGAGREVAARDTFEIAQWALGSKAADSLAQMAVRSAKGRPGLGLLVRERQDLVGERQIKDKLLIAAKSEPPEKRKAEPEKALADRLAAIDSHLDAIGRRLAQDFPDYAALINPAAVSVADVQGLLGDDEALVLFLDTPAAGPLAEETFVWVVTKSTVRWVRSELGTKALAREVTALRCGLNPLWYETDKERCAEALGMPRDRRLPPELPFDHARAHRLYEGLLGQVRDLIAGKHLLIAPSGALTQLPFQVLITRPPEAGDHRKAAWLIRNHAVTVLPAVSSLAALRKVATPSAATRPMLGFGNPLLEGPGGRYTALAKRARDEQRCPEADGRREPAAAGARTAAARIELRGGIASLAQVKRQMPLPETADELCAVAAQLKADAARDIHLGSRASEREIKRLNASGELASYRMLHFATHGVLAGTLDGAHEPGLIMSPPETATEEDDGYLSASEIAGLKLDADWVILSACDTAAGSATSAEALSGLARAFIYAGARTLLVSHWPVYSEATVKLVTRAVREMAGDARVGRAEAMRRAMLALLEEGTPEEADPSFWAPFVVVGEGAARR